MRTGESGVDYFAIRPEWAAEMAALELTSFPTSRPEDLYDEASLGLLAADFPQGGFAGFDDDQLVAMGIGIRIDFDLANPQHRVSDIIPHDNSTTGHVPDGDWYYGTSIAVRPDYRRRGIGAELYDLRKKVCHDLNLAGIVAGGVIPGYADHKSAMSADDYVAEVSVGRLYDRTLSFQLENGFVAPCALANYIEDPAVDNYAALIVWHNPNHQPTNG